MTEAMEICELLDDCGFFKKYSASKELACRGLARIYCKGRRQAECHRKKFKLEHGYSPSPDMLPNGKTIAVAAQKADIPS